MLSKSFPTPIIIKHPSKILLFLKKHRKAYDSSVYKKPSDYGHNHRLHLDQAAMGEKDRKSYG